MSTTTLRRISTTKLAERMDFIKTFRELSPTMTLPELSFFLAVARFPGHTIQQLGELIDTHKSNAGRYAASLGRGAPHRQGRKIQGLGLIRLDENPTNMKEKIVSLTNEGYALLEKLL